MLLLILKPLDQTIVPPRPQALQRLDYVVTQQIPLRCDELLCTAKGSLAFAGCCWTGEYIKGPALRGREGFYIWLTPPGYRIKPLSGGEGEWFQRTGDRPRFKAPLGNVSLADLLHSGAKGGLPGLIPLHLDLRNLHSAHAMAIFR